MILFYSCRGGVYLCPLILQVAYRFQNIPQHPHNHQARVVERRTLSSSICPPPRVEGMWPGMAQPDLPGSRLGLRGFMLSQFPMPSSHSTHILMFCPSLCKHIWDTGNVIQAYPEKWLYTKETQMCVNIYAQKQLNISPTKWIPPLNQSSTFCFVFIQFKSTKLTVEQETPNKPRKKCPTINIVARISQLNHPPVLKACVLVNRGQLAPQHSRISQLRDLR